MANNSISLDRRSLPDRRFLNDRRKFEERRFVTEGSKVKQISQATPFSVAFDFLCLMAVAALSLGVYIATGFYNSVTSPVAHVILGGGLFIYFLIMLRRGLGRDIFGFSYFWQKRM